MKNGSEPSSGSAFHHGTASAEHLIALIGNGDPGFGTPRDMIDDLVGQVMHIDDGFTDRRQSPSLSST